MPIPSYTPLDEALDRLSGYGPALANGNFNHAPMVAEALCALGRPDAVMPWIERYQPRMLPRASAGGTAAPRQHHRGTGAARRVARIRSVGRAGRSRRRYRRAARATDRAVCPDLSGQRP